MQKTKIHDLAGAANTSPQSVSNIITGRRRPSWKLATRLEDATGISATAWVGGLVNRKVLDDNYDFVKAAINDALRRKSRGDATEKKEKNGFEELNGGCGAGQQQGIAKNFSAALSVSFDPKKIVELRLACGLSSAALARMIGKLETEVVGWEFGLSLPDLGSIEAICSLFAISPGCLFESRITPIGENPQWRTPPPRESNQRKGKTP